MTEDRIELPFPSARVLVVSDFNCPYCFCLNEWLVSIGWSHRIRWIGIEHRPLLPSVGENNADDRAALRAEVLDVQRRAPETETVLPPLWANSRSALLTQNALEDEDPETAHAFRREVFRRYWHHGELPSDELVDRLCLDLGIERPAPEPDHLEELTDWWRDRLDRIPCMLAPTGVAHLGLQDLNTVRSFVNSALHSAEEGPGCR